jgi:ABC-type amino acid transport substrate-binding protein
MSIKKLILPSLILVALIVGLSFILNAHSRNNFASNPKDTSLADIKRKGKIIIASDIEFEPMEFYDKANNPIGLDIDLAHEIAKSLGVTAEIRMTYWNKVFPTVENGQADIGISSVTILPERAKEMLFSNPYFDSGQVLLVRKSDSSIHSPTDLKGKKVGVFPDTSGKTAISKYVDAKNLIDYETFEVPKNNPKSGILYDLKSGKLDAIVTDYIGAVGNIKNNPELKIAGEPFTQEYYGIITKLGNNSLMDEINHILNQMKTDDRLKQITNKWITVN